MKTMIKDFKKNQLEENWNQYNFQCPGNEVTFAHYICNEANNDPGFFRWLFDDETLADFECKDESTWQEFIKSEMTDEDNDNYEVTSNI